MQTKQKIRYAVDLGMTALLPLLMAYSLVGETAHEWLGVGRAHDRSLQNVQKILPKTH